MNPFIILEQEKVILSLSEIEKNTSSQLQFRLVQNLEEAAKLWNTFSPNQSLFDLWNFRYCAYKYLNFDIFFYVGYYNGETIGVLPLEWNSQKGYLEFFGGFYMEDNKVLIKKGYEAFVGEFYKQVTLPHKLSFISENSDFESSLELDENSYYVNTQKLGSFEAYLEEKFSHKTGRSFQKDINKIYERHSVEIIVDRCEDIEIMFEYSLKNFGAMCDLVLEPSESHFEKDIVQEFDTHFLSFVVDGKVEAVSMLTIYNGVLYGINGGINHGDIPNLGKLVFQKKIEFALEKGCHTYHVGVGSYNWKRDWRLDTIVQRHI